MACNSLMTTSLLQIVNRPVASCLSKLVFHRQVQQVVTGLQITSCNKLDLDLLQRDEIEEFVATC